MNQGDAHIIEKAVEGVEYELETQSRTLDSIKDTLESNGFQQETANLIEMMKFYTDNGWSYNADKLQMQIESRLGLTS